MNQDIALLITASSASSKLLAGMGAPGAGDVARPRARNSGRQCGAYAAARKALDQAGEFVPVEQAERRNLIMVNPVNRQHLCHQPQHRRRLPDGEGRRAGALPSPHRGGAAPRGRGQARHLYRGRWCPRLHGAGRRRADAVLVLARPRQRKRRRELLDRFPRCAVRAAFRGQFFEPNPKASKRSTWTGPSPPIGFRRGEALGTGATPPRPVEIAKDIMPTIGLHLVRLPAGARSARRQRPPSITLFRHQRRGAAWKIEGATEREPGRSAT